MIKVPFDNKIDRFDETVVRPRDAMNTNGKKKKKYEWIGLGTNREGRLYRRAGHIAGKTRSRRRRHGRWRAINGRVGRKSGTRSGAPDFEGPLLQGLQSGRVYCTLNILSRTTNRIIG